MTLSKTKVGVPVHCTTCGVRKSPIGRSSPPQLYLCEEDCPGYRQEPLPGSLWPGESEEEFGFPVGTVGTNEQS